MHSSYSLKITVHFFHVISLPSLHSPFSFHSEFNHSSFQRPVNVYHKRHNIFHSRGFPKLRTPLKKVLNSPPAHSTEPLKIIRCQCWWPNAQLEYTRVDEVSYILSFDSRAVSSHATHSPVHFHLKIKEQKKNVQKSLLRFISTRKLFSSMTYLQTHQSNSINSVK